MAVAVRWEQNALSADDWTVVGIRRALICVVVGAALAASCVASKPEPTVVTFEDGAGFVIEPFEPGECRFDTRSELIRLDAATGTVEWTQPTPYASWFDAVVTDDVVAVAISGGVAVADIDTGAPVWQLVDATQDMDAFTSEVAVEASWDDPMATARVLETGATLWSSTLSDTNARWLTAAGDDLYLDEDGTIHAIDPATGERRWTAATDGDFGTRPQTFDGELYVPSFRDIYRIDPGTGRSIWHHPLDERAGLDGPLHKVGDVVLVSTQFIFSGPDGKLEPPQAGPHQLIALDAGTGVELWRQPLATSLEHATNPDHVVAVGGDRSPAQDLGTAVVHRTGTNQLAMIATSNGATRWSIDVPPRSWLWDVAVGSNAIYIASTAENFSHTTITAYATDTGERLWTKTQTYTAGEPRGRMALTLLEQDLYLTVGYVEVGNLSDEPGGTIMRIDPATGARMWRVDTTQPATPPQPAPDDTLIVVTSDPDIGCD
jgi:outer membrane protein assembly factor BamB